MDIVKRVVSVIIPVYNVAPYLRNALNSVVVQKYHNLEIIIVDDGSTDGSEKICDEYGKMDERIHVFHQSNKGLSYARNVGLDKMTGDYVSFLDSDDEYHPEYISKMINAIQKENAELVVCKYITPKHNKAKHDRRDITKPTIEPGVYDRINALRALCDKSINMSVWNKLYVSRLWQDIRFPVGHVCEDEEVTCKIIDQCKKIIILNEPLYHYRLVPGSITNTISWRHINDKILATDKVERFIRERIPVVFLEKHLIMYNKCQFEQLIICYLVSLLIRDENRNRNELRVKIIRLGNETNSQTCKLRFKVAFWMIHFSPWLLKLIYPLYHYGHGFFTR